MGSQQDSRHLMEVKQADSKGLGGFAVADIPRGTRILAEEGMLQIVGAHAEAKEILDAFERISKSQQNSYLELHAYAHQNLIRAVERELGQRWNDISELHRKVLSVWAANTFGDVFLLGSRFNHSCIPNVDFAYNTNLKKETFHAVREIAAGQELTVMYIDGVCLTHAHRQGKLDNWGFTCMCLACDTAAPGYQASEDKRALLFQHDQALERSVRYRQWDKAQTAAQKLAAIQFSEGFLGRCISHSYHDAARACAILGKTRLALLWAEKELESDRFCVGEDHPDYPEKRDFVEELRQAVEGGKRPVGQSVIG